MVKRKKNTNEGEIPTCTPVTAVSPPNPDPPEDWTRCHAYNHHKTRFCRQEKHTNSEKYCGNHLHLQGDERKRIKCPIDPSHYIFADSLDKHVKKCPKTIQLEKLAEENYFRFECNRGGHGTFVRPSCASSCDNNATSAGIRDLEAAKRLALRVLQVHQEIFHCNDAPDGKAPVAMDHSPASLQEATIYAAIPVVDLSQPELDAGLGSAAGDYRIKIGGARHLHQQASLVGHLRRIGALQTLNANATGVDASNKLRPRRIFEMGAGRGMTGLVAAGVSARLRPTQLVMIEKGSSRSRAEKVLRKVKAFPEEFSCTSPYLNIANVDYERIKCDLAHVDMCKTCTETATTKTAEYGTDIGTSNAMACTGKEEEIVVIAKHLCGVGTDLALKSLESIKEKVTCCIMSTCCHGACYWRDYVGRDYLIEAMTHPIELSCFGEEEFELLRIWSSGTVWDGGVDGGDNPPSNVEDEHRKPFLRDEYKISDNERFRNVARIAETLRLQCGPRGLGRACQRLIDYGRREYLRHVIFSDAKCNTQILYYVPVEVTPQNAILIAHRYS